ncbi:ADP-ribosylglycohydrolase family protein [Actinokineospora iranica]|uniref:ADP-ribosylglycohydrolase n=1 Tax=Actinokineospora iranica TaxID=1271860 RepID=A0A1G6R098_9PSEU|nr:ADP-ribosylglycohydrolase family protein [Actinokineospora iranica]SDC97978.1 ADP-ribosylglycohydrolase [Actinokineospora iranica]
MEATAAVAKVEEWLRAVHGPQMAGLRVEHEKVRLVPEGWSVPYNSVAYLDGGDAGKEIFPPPRLIVREPDGELREPSPQPGGVSVPARMPGQEYWAEIIDPEVALSGLGYLGVPARAIGGWRKVLPDGTSTGVERENPGYRPGPRRMGIEWLENPVDWMMAFRAVGWFDDEKLAIALTQAVVFTSGGHTTFCPVYSSTRRLPADTTTWRRVDVATLVGELPDDMGVLFYGGEGPLELRAGDIAAALARFPRVQPPVDMEGSRFEFSAEVERLTEETAARLGLAKPARSPEHEARYARINDVELTDDEIRKTVLAKSWRQLVYETKEPRWPDDLAANGLTWTYDDNGKPIPTKDTFGKYCADAPKGFRFNWRRVSGAFVGFALGEALGAAVDRLSLDEIHARHGVPGVLGLQPAYERPGQIGPLTQRLLFLTEGVIRSPHRDVDAADHAVFADAAAGGLLRWLHTQGDWVPIEVDGWLVKVADLYADRLPDPDELAAIRALADGNRGTGSGSGALLAALPAALTVGGPGTGLDQGVPIAARLLAGLTHAAGIDIAATEYLARLFEQVLAVNIGSMPVWISGRKVQVPEVTPAATAALPDFKKFGLPDVRTPENLGAGRDSLTALGQALAAISGFEHRPEVALLRAVNHSGRSALTGALAGALLGARTGIPGLPRAWVDQLDLRHLVETLATDAYRRYHRASPMDAGTWTTRYPRT